MQCFPVISWHHLDRVPGATIEKRAIGSFANTLLTTYAEIGIDFDSTETKVVFDAQRKIEKIVPVQRNRARRLLIRWEKKVANYVGLLHLQFAIVALRTAGVFG